MAVSTPEKRLNVNRSPPKVSFRKIIKSDSYEEVINKIPQIWITPPTPETVRFSPFKVVDHSLLHHGYCACAINRPKNTITPQSYDKSLEMRVKQKVRKAKERKMKKKVQKAMVKKAFAKVIKMKEKSMRDMETVFREMREKMEEFKTLSAECRKDLKEFSDFLEQFENDNAFYLNEWKTGLYF